MDEVNALRSDEAIGSWRDFLSLYYDAFFDPRMMIVPRKPIDRALRFQILLKTELGQQLGRYEKFLGKNDGQLFASSEV